MRHSVIRKLLQRIPFQPLRLYMSNGKELEVNDPDWVSVTPSTVELLVPAGDGQREMVIVQVAGVMRRLETKTAFADVACGEAMPLRMGTPRVERRQAAGGRSGGCRTDSCLTATFPVVRCCLATH